MLKMKDLLQEGRNIQDKFKKRMSINEGSAVITVPVEDSYDQYGEGEYFQELLKKKGIKSTFEQQMSDIELTVDEKDAKKAVAILSNAGYAPTLNVVVGKNIQTVGKTNLPSSAKGGSVILNFYAAGGGAYTKKDEANFAIEVLKKKGIKAKLVKFDQFDDQVSLKVSKADAKKAIEVLSDNGIEIE